MEFFMDDTIIQSLEKLFYNKIMLYNDLLDCFKKEREVLINLDLDKLWGIFKEKEQICSNIKSIRQEIISAINLNIDQKSFIPNQILELIPGENRAKFQKLSLTLKGLKAEIEALRKENTIFIDDSLHFLDEMISIITGETKSKIMYNDKCHLSKSDTNIFLSREA
jgi:predicted XRE-type DNA-binding protein